MSYHQPHNQLIAQSKDQTPVNYNEIASNDDALINLWVKSSNSVHTRRARFEDARYLINNIIKPLNQITVGDLINLFDAIPGSESSVARKVRHIKSLFTFAHTIGYIKFNVASVLKSPSVKQTLSERIISERDVHLLIDAEKNQRNKTILTLFYASGIRISELTSLCWKDFQDRGNGIYQITVYGKGGKTRSILLSETTGKLVQSLQKIKNPDEPIFVSAKGGHLDQSAVHRLVKAAAARAGISPEMSAHWLRHAHASHALDRGCPIHLVQSTLGHSSVATTGLYTHCRPSDGSSTYLSV